MVHMHRYISACLFANMRAPVWPTYVSQSPLVWSHTLVRMCTCISTCMNVNLARHVCLVCLVLFERDLD